MVMYSEGLSKVLSMTGWFYLFFKQILLTKYLIFVLKDHKPEHHCSTLAKMVISKIINEQTLNSAAQSVLDEVSNFFLLTF